MDYARPAALRVAIMGSGPSGCYAAGHLLRHDSPEIHVDMFERLPTPWGLVRAGVAPDHPKIKSVTRIYERTAAHPRFRLFSNVEFGCHFTLEDLRERYSAVVYAVGTPVGRRLGIPGEELPGSHAATTFVGWYNGHPDFRDFDFDLSGSRAVVIGAGNVALDVARMLTVPPTSLRRTDIADHALQRLEQSAVTEVDVIARRGPEQAAFTNPELLELDELTEADVIIDPAQLDIAEALPDPSAGTTAKRNVQIMRDYAGRGTAGRPKRLALRFLLSPVELRGDGRVEEVLCTRNVLEPGPDGALSARPTGEQVALAARLVIRATGYCGTALPGVPFDERRGVIPNVGGRVRAGEYVVGWAKRGPSGVIGTNKKDAQETVEAVLADLEAGALAPPSIADADEVAALLTERQPDVLDYAHWQIIDRYEQGLGEPHGRPRVKLTRVGELLAAAGCTG